MRRSLCLTVVALVCAALPAAAASADVSVGYSTNWSGYAVGGPGITYRAVSGAWVVPKVTCAEHHATSSGAWVGLGGSGADSKALEQLGTDFSCAGHDKPRYRAWHEIVPERSHYPDITIKPGDVISASVTVTGRHVQMRLDNLTRHRHFTVDRMPDKVDVSSAEWIVESPTLCVGTYLTGTCSVSPLTNFGTVAFSGATATTADGHAGTIPDPTWGAVALTLTPKPGHAPKGGPKHASPSPLSPDGTPFSVTWADGAAPPVSAPAPDPAPAPAAGRAFLLR